MAWGWGRSYCWRLSYRPVPGLRKSGIPAAETESTEVTAHDSNTKLRPAPYWTTPVVSWMWWHWKCLCIPVPWRFIISDDDTWQWCCTSHLLWALIYLHAFSRTYTWVSAVSRKWGCWLSHPVKLHKIRHDWEPLRTGAVTLYCVLCMIHNSTKCIIGFQVKIADKN